MKENKVEIDNNEEKFIVKINGLLHICIEKSDLLHIQSWIDSQNFLYRFFKYFLAKRCCLYNIDFYTKNGKIESGYNDRKIWSKILKELS